MAKLTDREVISLVNQEFEGAMGAPRGQISIERARNLDYYMAKPLGNEVKGQSQVVTSDVSDVVDGIMPSLLRMFTTKENLISFDAVGPEDVPQAEQESDYVNYVFFKQNPAFEIMYSWFFDALVQKNGIIKAWYDESETVTTENYQGLTEMELLDMLSDDELEAVERAERIEDGVTVHDVMFKRTCKEGKFKIENVPPEEYRISADARGIDPCKARMVGQERDISRSDLVSMGFGKNLVMSLPTVGGGHESEEEVARYNRSEEISDNWGDKSMQLVEVREAYIHMDYDGTGRAELRQVITAGNVVLTNEPADRQPFHVICPQPIPHKHFGRCPAERVIDIQEVSTTLLRQSLDNLYQTNNPEHNVWEQGIGENTLDDLLTRRIGKVNRFARPPGESHSLNVVPFTAEASLGALSYFDKVKRDRTGVNSDSEGLSPEQLKNIQTTVMAQANDLSRMKIEAITRIFAETGIKSLFLHLHELILKYRKKEQVIMLRNQWVEVNPQSWRTRYDMTVNIGLGVGTKESNMAVLNDIWDKQRQMIEGGGLNLTVTPENIYNTAAEVVKNGNYKNADMFFMNPANIDPQQMQQEEGPDPQMAAIEAQIQIETAKLQQKEGESQRKHAEAMASLEQKYEEQQDKLATDFEKLRNQLTEMELKYEKDIDGNGKIGNVNERVFNYNPATGEMSEG